MSIYQMRTNCQIFVSSNAPMEGSTCLSNMFCISMFVDSQFYNYFWWVDIVSLKVIFWFLAKANCLQCRGNLITKVMLLPLKCISSYLVTTQLQVVDKYSHCARYYHQCFLSAMFAEALKRIMLGLLKIINKWMRRTNYM